MSDSPVNPALFQRLGESGRAPISFTLDGELLQAMQGDTIMTAVLTHQSQLRRSEFSASARAGFCLMGACQDCWIGSESGQRYRACSTLLVPGMRLLTHVATDA
jgi:predicted molibdopterin-dependent oxidoreductase YjgC